MFIRNYVDEFIWHHLYSIRMPPTPPPTNTSLKNCHYKVELSLQLMLTFPAMGNFPYGMRHVELCSKLYFLGGEHLIWERDYGRLEPYVMDFPQDVYVFDPSTYFYDFRYRQHVNFKAIWSDPGHFIVNRTIFLFTPNRSIICSNLYSQVVSTFSRSLGGAAIL